MKKEIKYLIIGYIFAFLFLGLMGYMAHKILNIPISDLLFGFGFCVFISIVLGIIAYILGEKKNKK